MFANIKFSYSQFPLGRPDGLTSPGSSKHEHTPVLVSGVRGLVEAPAAPAHRCSMHRGAVQGHLHQHQPVTDIVAHMTLPADYRPSPLHQPLLRRTSTSLVHQHQHRGGAPAPAWCTNSVQHHQLWCTDRHQWCHTTAGPPGEVVTHTHSKLAWFDRASTLY